MSKAATMATTRIPAEVEVPDAERLRAWRKLARALIRAFRQLWAMVFGGSLDELRGDLATARRVAGKAGGTGLGALIGVGKGLDLGIRATHGVTSTVGGLLGALLPSQPPGPADVAAAAAAQDDRRTRATDGLRDSVRAELAGAPAPAALVLPEPKPRPALSPVETVEAVREAIARMQRDDLTAQDVLARLPHRVEKWVLMLDDESAKRLLALPSGDLYRHVSGVAAAPGIPPLSTTSPSARFTQEDLATIVKRSMATMRADEAEISKMAGRPGAAPRAGPPLDGDTLRR